VLWARLGIGYGEVARMPLAMTLALLAHVRSARETPDDDVPTSL